MGVSKHFQWSEMLYYDGVLLYVEKVVLDGELLRVQSKKSVVHHWSFCANSK